MPIPDRTPANSALRRILDEIARICAETGAIVHWEPHPDRADLHFEGDPVWTLCLVPRTDSRTFAKTAHLDIRYILADRERDFPRIKTLLERLATEILRLDQAPIDAKSFDGIHRQLVSRDVSLLFWLQQPCGYHCVFCDYGRHGPAGDRQSQPEPGVEDQLRANRGMRNEVKFYAEDVAVHPRLPEYLRLARELGYPCRHVYTPGGRLADEALARSLAAAGMTRVTMSLYAGDADLHDQMTGLPGSFERHLRALDVLSGLDVQVTLNTCVTTRNLEAIPEVAEIAVRRGLRFQVQAWVPEGRLRPVVPGLMPSWLDVTTMLRRHAASFPDPTVLCAVPLCVLRGLDRQFQALPERTSVPFPLLAGPPCSACARREDCAGIHSWYAETHGIGEFEPFTG